MRIRSPRRLSGRALLGALKGFALPLAIAGLGLVFALRAGLSPRAAPALAQARPPAGPPTQLPPLPARPDRPRLLLVVVVDQLRGDALERFDPFFTDKGFRRLLREGASYPSARYLHAITQTAPGHATIATGGHPYAHGIVGNRWIDRETGARVYCVEDPDAGRSPRNLRSSTFVDELVAWSGGASRAVSISAKDRGAILLAGRLGRAYWFDHEAAALTTSKFYEPALPPHIAAWSDARPTERYRGRPWQRALPDASYAWLGRDDAPWERDAPVLGRAFPHALPGGAATPQELAWTMGATPFPNELLLDLARTIVRVEGLGGREGVTDVLTVSFSSTDIVGHVFGPDSHEALDAIARLDRVLGELLDLVDTTVGRDRALVVLASDHGVSPAPELAAARGFAAGRIAPADLRARVDAALDAAFGADDWVAGFGLPSIYLDRAKLAARKIDPAAAERVAADALLAHPGIAAALTRSDLVAGRVPPHRVGRAIALAFDPRRSGDVVVAAAPFWYLDGEDPEEAATTHGTPWAYDGHVPIVLRGPGVRPGRYERQVSPADIAPTIARLLGTVPPSACEGEPLVEAIAR